MPRSDPSAGPRYLSLRAPAKVNLCLRVLGRRPDGYHDLHMLMAPVGLFDELRLTRLAEPGCIEMLCEGGAGVQAGDDNLCHRASHYYFTCTGVPGGVRVELVKRIPAGAGLGGGSSDAAVTILGLERLYGQSLSAEQRSAAAFAVGADVPFFFARGPAWVDGIGERVRPLPELPSVWMVLIFPGVFLSTAKVFSRLNTGLTRPGQAPTIAQFNFRGLVEGLHNDLQEAATAVEPVIHEALVALDEEGARGRLMSGSGSAVFGLFSSEREARDAAQAVSCRPEAAAWQIAAVPTLSPGAFPFQ